jgi:hypothetical protein
MGKIYLGSQGIPVANAPIAEIWVSYEIDLYKPILGGLNLISWYYTAQLINNTAGLLFGAAVNTTLIPKAGSSTLIKGQIGANPWVMTVTLPDLDAYYMISWQMASSLTTQILGNPTFGVSPGSTFVSFFNDGWNNTGGVPKNLFANPFFRLGSTSFAREELDYNIIIRVQSKDIIGNTGVTIDCTLIAASLLSQNRSCNILVQQMDDALFK